MTAGRDAGPTAATAGTPYHGRPTRRVANDHLWLDVLATAGPRIVRLGCTGSNRNWLAETPDDGWDTPHGRYELLGGHRLWVAPEDPERAAIPDGDGLTLTETRDGVVLEGRPEVATGLVRTMALALDPQRPAFVLRHGLRNVGHEPVELAPWAITQLPLGGTILLPQVPAATGHHVRPNRMLVLWPYTSWEDGRFVPRDGLLTLTATAGPSLKLGYYNDLGWVGYAHEGSLLVRRFEPGAGLPHPDLGCNVETYVGSRFLELELLGPLRRLDPGGTATLVERWELHAAATSDPRALAALGDRG